MNEIQIGGIFVFVLFYGSYYIKMFNQRRAGIKTDQLGQGNKNAQTVRTEQMLKRSTMAIAVIQVCSIFMKGSEMNFSVSSPVVWAGLGIALAGCLLLITTMITMRNSWRAGVVLNEPTTLVTKGIFRFSRNPAFLGFDLFYIGFALAFPNWILLLVSLIGVIMMHLQILEEEKNLILLYGKPYQTYKQQTPRYMLFF